MGFKSFLTKIHSPHGRLITGVQIRFSIRVFAKFLTSNARPTFRKILGRKENYFVLVLSFMITETLQNISTVVGDE